MSLSSSQNFCAPVNFDKAIWLNQCIFLKNWVVGDQRVKKFQLSLAIARRTFNRFWIAFNIPNFKLKYEDSENITVDQVDTVVFNLHQIKRQALFFDIQYLLEMS